MSTDSASYHEPFDRLPAAVHDRHRAIASLMEELEAVDWYEQRIAATSDHELAAILRHNRDEEKEHAAMVLEWLRRRDPTFDEHLRTYLFTEGSVVDLEDDGEAGDAGAGDARDGPDGRGDLGVRTSKGTSEE